MPLKNACPTIFLQHDLITLLAYSEEHALKVYSTITVDQFESDIKTVAIKVYEYIKTYRMPPKDHIFNLFDAALSPEKDDDRAKRRARNLFVVLRAIHANAENVNPASTLDQMTLFVCHQYAINAAAKALSLIESTMSEETIVKYQTILIDALYQIRATKPELGIAGTDVVTRDPEFLWRPYIPFGEITILAGMGDAGKGHMLASIAARVAPKGRRSYWPDSSDVVPRGNVLWTESEDSIDKTLVNRLLAAGADLNRFRFMRPKEFLRIDLGSYIEEKDIRLVVLCAIGPCLPSMKSTNSDNEVEARLAGLQETIDGKKCAIIGVRNLSKKEDVSAIERILGSVVWVNFTRQGEMAAGC